MTIPKVIEEFRGVKVLSVVSYNEHTAALVALTNDPSLLSLSDISNSTTLDDPETRFVNDFRTMLTEGLFADVKVLVE